MRRDDPGAMVPRLQILRDVLPLLHTSRAEDGGAHGTLGAIKLGLTSGDAQVRAAAVEAAAEAYRCLGRSGVAPVLLSGGCPIPRDVARDMASGLAKKEKTKCFLKTINNFIKNQ